ncbi:hypothetical protein BW12_04895 [Bifidobacterium sp. UTCIF-3]|uniref:DUF4417 domain-containing protein n=1 Tax=unclassified Bifidobacterium TaxID=2608897 RepID=UPI00112E403A|nr:MULTISPECIES: DUF4417 domain-containing protein [unclassified Bifidobacterium]TPF78748.1 hypothetical protein BW09_03300 [Bifidobacterium sp. UTCIF-1]TPF80632.1 hypothetical protein BW08_04230 [Bifidobacterium sp. UTCIF-24]TPF82270.1 hypothetical protein BW12_04895 [Bifidobacterium sp. UTCIF-3]TPF84548.1 hypothetical protein BW07_03450 [Bifidobacterium sp. UTCIF-36]
MISALTDILALIDEYSRYLEEHGVRCDDQGFPLMQPEWYLNEWPDLVVTYRERGSQLVSDPAHTVLCFYCSDDRIYPRLEQVLEELDEYRPFMGVIGSDVTVTADMDIEWQRLIILLNQLFDAVLAVNGIKLVQNLRIGLPSTLVCLLNVPEGVMAASGTLGCEPTAEGDFSYAVKVHTLMPSKVILYGRRDPVMESQLDAARIPYRHYDDVHTLYRRRLT